MSLLGYCLVKENGGKRKRQELVKWMGNIWGGDRGFFPLGSFSLGYRIPSRGFKHHVDADKS